MPAEETEQRAAKKQKKERTAELAALPEERKVGRRAATPPPSPPPAPCTRAPLQRRLPSATGKAISAAKKTSTREKTIALQLAATTDTVKAGVCPKDAAAAEQLSEIFGVEVTVETIVQYEKKVTTQDKPYFVPSIEGTPLVPDSISLAKCNHKLGPRAIRRLHGVA